MQDASKKTKMHLRRKKIMELLAQNGEYASLWRTQNGKA